MKKYTYLIIISSLIFIGWGKTGHKIINQNATSAFSSDIIFINQWADVLINHASDADSRKSSDPTESPKHFIDIDEYSDFISKRKIIQDYDSLIQKYGESVVIDRGILPWAIIKTVESLTSAFSVKDWNKAMLIASDLGHYVGDAHMPLHITTNYNGQLTGQTGIHSRYESTMIGDYSSEILYEPEQCKYIADVSNYVFELIYNNYNYVDSVLIADKNAKLISQGSYNSLYYQNLWKSTKGFTVNLFSNASFNLASLIYTAWINAGKPIITELKYEVAEASNFQLFQNYPNPFNPVTVIEYSVGTKRNFETQLVKLEIFDALGNKVRTLVNEYITPGNYKVAFDGNNLASGIYYYRLQAGNFLEVKKMILLR